MLHPTDPIQVLIVGNDSPDVSWLETLLCDHGFDVVTASDGQSAFQIISQSGPPLVLTDWNLPGFNGLELCRNVRASEGVGFTYVMILSAEKSVDELTLAFESGADDYITKPFDQRELLCRLNAAERIIRLEAFYRQQTIQIHKVNAEIAVTNSKLQRLSHRLKISRDEAHKASFEAQQANRAKTEFLANMSHEVRTPMTAILGYLDVLDPQSSSRGSETEQIEAFHAIRRNGEHLLQVITDILEVSKIEAGALTCHPSPCSVTAILEEIATTLRPRAQTKSLALDIEYHWPLPETVDVDPTRLRQILLNLVGNAIKFTDAGGVRICASYHPRPDSPGELIVAVSDTGIGMTPDQIARLFRPFVQVDTTFSRRFEGTGLGLFIAQRLAHMLKGTLTVESRPNVGSNFTLTLPTPDSARTRLHHRFPEATTPGKVSSHGTAKPLVDSAAPLADRNILLVEDNPDNQKLVTRMLQNAGAVVALAENGKVAVDTYHNPTLQNRPLDLILMDMQMPIMDGFEAANILRKDGCNIPIIALTAFASSTDRERCLQAGCSDFVTKPVNRLHLIETIRKHLQLPSDSIEVDTDLSTHPSPSLTHAR